MKVFRKSIFLLVILLILAAAFPVSAETAESGTCGMNLTWTLDSDGLLTISGVGDFKDYSSYTAAPWPADKVKKVVIGEGVTSIGNYAFNNCTALRSVEIPEGVKFIDSYAFANCTELQTLALPKSLTTVSTNAFDGCSKLTGITVAAGNTKYKSFDGALYVLFDFGTQSRLICCPATKSGSVTLPADAADIEPNVFGSCTKVTDILVEEGNEALTSIDGILYSKDLTRILCCPPGKAGAVKVAEGVKIINSNQGVFFGCTKLTSITLPESLEMLANDPFASCTALEEILVNDSNTDFTSIDGILYYTDYQNETSAVCCPKGKSGSVTIPEGTARIFDTVFSGCKGITSIKIPDSVHTIGDGAFSGCTALKSIDIPDGVTRIEQYTFRDCTALKSVDLPDSVTYIGQQAFFNCAALKSISIENVNNIYDRAFAGCSSLETVKMPKKMKPSEYGGICEAAFENCTSLKSISIPEGLTTVAWSAFSGCSDLESVTMADTVTKIYESAFRNCTALKSVKLSKSLELIDRYAFFGCSSLEAISVPSGITNINDESFASSGLKTVTFEGDAPGCYQYSRPFSGLTLTAYYPKGNDTWTAEIKKLLEDGADITWKTYKAGSDPTATPLKITSQPKTSYKTLDEKAKYTVKAEGDGLEYQWYYKSAGSLKYKKASCTKATYTITTTEDRKDRAFYCKVTDKYGNSVKSKTVYMRVAASVKTQPKTQYVQLDEKAKFTVKAIGDDLKYQWYYKSAGSSKYKKASCTKATYSITMTEDRKDRKFYCIITDEYGNEVKTNTVTMRMAASIKTEPKSVTTSIGKKAKFTVKAVGDDLKYQWYYKDVDGKKYKKASGTKATYTTELTKARNGRKFYCVVTDKYGNTVKTKTVSMKKK